MGTGMQSILARALLSRAPASVRALPGAVFQDNAELQEAERALRFLRGELISDSGDVRFDSSFDELGEKLSSGSRTATELRRTVVAFMSALQEGFADKYSYASSVAGARLSLFADGQQTMAELTRALAKRKEGGSDIELSPAFNSFLILLIERGYVHAHARVWGAMPVKSALELKDAAKLPEALYRFAITETDQALTDRAIDFLIEGTTIDGFPNRLFAEYLCQLALVSPNLFERKHLERIQEVRNIVMRRGLSVEDLRETNSSSKLVGQLTRVERILTERFNQ